VLRNNWSLVVREANKYPNISIDEAGFRKLLWDSLIVSIVLHMCR
jgi:hypothetical protein